MDNETQDGTEVVKHEDVAQVMERTGGRFDLAEVGDPTAGLETARRLVSYMSEKCRGPEYIAEIQGRQYPKVDWWTTVGGGLGLFPREESCRKLERPNETAYEATVGVYNGDQLVTRASAICSSKESTWEDRDEYAIRSMAITRATGKAYRVGLSFLPVMAGLEPTPAEEMPGGGSGQQEHTCIDLDETLGFGQYDEKTWREVAETDPGYIGWLKKEGTDRLCDDDYDRLRAVARPEGGGESEDESGAKAAESPATQWIRLWERHRPEKGAKARREWETDTLLAKLDDVPTTSDDLVDHNELASEHYETLADALMDEVEKASQTEIPA